ncbi:MAG: sensor histidine kinase [Gemmatimonadetes bacterium]|nr:sensor histidine kinase [Gemmatimonadota bacterium]
MDALATPPTTTELAAAYLQLAVTLGLLAMCAVLHRRYRRPYFGLWALAWGVYALRLTSIITFLHTERSVWLFWHQVTTGWTALALLWATLVFTQRLVWKNAYLALALVPPVWSWVAIYVVDSFAWAAAPMVGFLSLTTAWAAWAFFRYDRLVRSPAARFLVGVLSLWALHHLDYPFLRAQGAWSPWGYYLDITFELGMGLGILLLVLEDLDQGLRTLTALSGELQSAGHTDGTMTEAMLRRALSLRGVHGSALWLASPQGDRFVQGAGVAALWPFESPPEAALQSARDVSKSGMPSVISGGHGFHTYTAALPVLSDDAVVGALVVVGEARDPFTVLDNRFLLAFGQQVGAALANEDLHKSVAARTQELERLQASMVRQHEEERNRLWRELHDETAQVLAALNLQLGLVEERGDAAIAPALARAKTLVGEGIKSIRSVTRNLRPLALDDLGLVPALRALARDFGDRDAFEVSFQAPAQLPRLSADAEVALYRALQEALANAVRHGSSRRVEARLEADAERVALTVTDDGSGFPPDAAHRLRSRGGLAGIRERITALGGDLAFSNVNGGGARVQVRVPVERKESA